MNELLDEKLDTEEEWFTLDDITESSNTEPLYCVAVDAPEKQFLVGKSGIPTHNTDEGKEEDSMKGEAAMILGSIARLGRAAGVHLVIATQRPDAKIISGETKANLGVRINCGRTDSNASSMILGNGEGLRVKSFPRGRLYLRIFGDGDHGQGFFAQPDWIDKYLESKGLNPDGTPISQKRSRLATLRDMSELAETDLDEQEGIDNSAIIEQIRQQEEAGEDSADDDDDDSVDWGFVGDDEDDSQEPEEDSFGRPELTGGESKPDFSRPEDSWDADLEALIDENNN